MTTKNNALNGSTIKMRNAPTTQPINAPKIGISAVKATSTPYAKENEEDNWMELDLSDEDIFLDHFLDEETKKTSD